MPATFPLPPGAALRALWLVVLLAAPACGSDGPSGPPPGSIAGVWTTRVARTCPETGVADTRRVTLAEAGPAVSGTAENVHCGAVEASARINGTVEWREDGSPDVRFGYVLLTELRLFAGTIAAGKLAGVEKVQPAACANSRCPFAETDTVAYVYAKAR